MSADDGADSRGDMREMSVGREGGGPGDIAMAGRVERVAAFGENPSAAAKLFAEGKEIGGNVARAFRESLFGVGELVHEGEAEIVFGGAEVDGGETPREPLGSLPTDLAANASGITDGVNVTKAKESKEDGFKKMPVVGATGEEGAEPEVGILQFVNVNGGEIASAAGGDIEAEAILGAFDEDGGEALVEKVLDSFFAGTVAGRAEVAELIGDFVLFEVDARDFVIEGALLDDRPFDDGGPGRKRIAEVGLFVNILEAGAGAAVGEKFVFRQWRGAIAVDEVKEAEVEGVGHGDAEV